MYHCLDAGFQGLKGVSLMVSVVLKSAAKPGALESIPGTAEPNPLPLDPCEKS